MDGRRLDNQNISLGRATAAVASGAAQWEIEEGKAGYVFILFFFFCRMQLQGLMKNLICIFI